MTDEPTGQSPQDNVSPDTPEPATQPDSTQTDVDDGLPERFKGKSPAEIAQSYLELEKKLGDHGRELGELKNQLAFMENQSQFQQQAPQYQQPAYQGQQFAENYDDQFLESPFQTTMQTLREYDRYKTMTDSTRFLPMAMQMAVDARPDLYDSPEARQQVQQTIQMGVRSGRFLPETQTDPNSINAIALWMKDQRTQKSPPKQGVQPVATEAPPQVKRAEPVKPPVDFDEISESTIRYFREKVPGFEDLDKEKAAELVREERSEREKP